MLGGHFSAAPVADAIKIEEKCVLRNQRSSSRGDQCGLKNWKLCVDYGKLTCGRQIPAMFEIHSTGGIMVSRSIEIPYLLRVRVSGRVCQRGLWESGTVVGKCGDVNFGGGPGKSVLFIVEGHRPTATVRMHEEYNSLRAVLRRVKVAHMVSLSKAQQHGKLQQYVENLFFHIQQNDSKISDSPDRQQHGFIDCCYRSDTIQSPCFVWRFF